MPDLSGAGVSPDERLVGDDWTFGPVSVPSGTVVTALLYQSFSLAPVATLDTQSGVTLSADLPIGRTATISVPKSITAKVPAQTRFATAFPTRLRVIATDTSGASTTVAVFAILPLDSRVDFPVTA